MICTYHKLTSSTLQLISARCPYLGVSGSTLQGGLSWLSSEHGLSSDPSNLLDVEIALMDGTLKWASSDPELLWALRGGGGRFGVVTRFKFRARKYAESVYGGMIVYPREALGALAKGVERFARENEDRRVAMHFCCLDLVQGAFVGGGSVEGLAVMVYDGNGEEHGRGVFAWALGIEGAVDWTRGMSYREVVQASGEFWRAFLLRGCYPERVTNWRICRGTGSDSWTDEYDDDGGHYPGDYRGNYSQSLQVVWRSAYSGA